MTGYLTDADQKTPDWLNTFLGEVETVVRLCLSPGLVSWPKCCHVGPVVFFLIP